METYDYEELNTKISNMSLLWEGFYLSSFLIQPHVFHMTVPLVQMSKQKQAHQTYEISMILKGEVHYFIEDNEVVLKPGDVIMIPPGKKHYWQVGDFNAETVISGFMCFISAKGLHPRKRIHMLHEAIAKRKYHLRQPNEYKKAIYRMLDIIQSPVPFYEEEVRNLLKLSYIFLFRTLLPQWGYSGRPGKRCGARMSRDKTVELIKYYIGDNISHPIKLTELAKHIGMSKDYMNRIFKEKNNVSIGQFITSTRIELASKMLSTTNHDVKTIAFENGFSDFNYFCTVFKKHTGLTPTRFRHLNRVN